MQGFSRLFFCSEIPTHTHTYTPSPAASWNPTSLVTLFSSRDPIPNWHTRFWKKTTSSLDQARWLACVSSQERYNKVESASCKVIKKTGSPTEAWYNSEPRRYSSAATHSFLSEFSHLYIGEKTPVLWASLLGSVEIMQAKAFCKLWNTSPV